MGITKGTEGRPSPPFVRVHHEDAVQHCRYNGEGRDRNEYRGGSSGTGVSSLSLSSPLLTATTTITLAATVFIIIIIVIRRATAVILAPPSPPPPLLPPTAVDTAAEYGDHGDAEFIDVGGPVRRPIVLGGGGVAVEVDGHIVVLEDDLLRSRGGIAAVVIADRAAVMAVAVVVVMMADGVGGVAVNDHLVQLADDAVEAGAVVKVGFPSSTSAARSWSCSCTAARVSRIAGHHGSVGAGVDVDGGALAQAVRQTVETVEGAGGAVVRAIVVREGAGGHEGGGQLSVLLVLRLIVFIAVVAFCAAARLSRGPPVHHYHARTYHVAIAVAAVAIGRIEQRRGGRRYEAKGG